MKIGLKLNCVQFSRCIYFYCHSLSAKDRVLRDKDRKRRDEEEKRAHELESARNDYATHRLTADEKNKALVLHIV